MPANLSDRILVVLLALQDTHGAGCHGRTHRGHLAVQQSDELYEIPCRSDGTHRAKRRTPAGLKIRRSATRLKACCPSWTSQTALIRGRGDSQLKQHDLY